MNNLKRYQDKSNLKIKILIAMVEINELLDKSR